VPHHDTFARKLEHARLLRDEVGISRPILVDDLSGSTHRRYGAMPNMTWVVDRGGRVLYKASWTSAGNVVGFLERLSASRDKETPGTTQVRYETEQVELRATDNRLFHQRLQRNGDRAVREFEQALALWRQG